MNLGKLLKTLSRAAKVAVKAAPAVVVAWSAVKGAVKDAKKP
jgi:hypothetical protein